MEIWIHLVSAPLALHSFRATRFAVRSITNARNCSTTTSRADVPTLANTRRPRPAERVKGAPEVRPEPGRVPARRPSRRRCRQVGGSAGSPSRRGSRLNAAPWYCGASSETVSWSDAAPRADLVLSARTSARPSLESARGSPLGCPETSKARAPVAANARCSRFRSTVHRDALVAASEPDAVPASPLARSHV